MVHQGNGSVATGVVFGLITALIWGAWPVVSGLGLQNTLTAYDITALRFGVAGIVLFPVLWKRGLRNVEPKAIALMVCGAGSPYVLLSVFGLTFAPAGHFGVVTPSSMLVFASIGGWLVLGERPGLNRFIGLIAIISGVVLIGWEGMRQGSADAWIGELIFVCCGFLWATYTITSRAFKVEPLHATALVSVFSMIIYLPFYFGMGLSNLSGLTLMEITVQGVFHGIITAVVALLCYTRSVAILGAGRGAVFAALVPGTAMLMAWPALGERPHFLGVMGLITVTCGMIYSIKPTRNALNSGKGVNLLPRFRQ